MVNIFDKRLPSIDFLDTMVLKLIEREFIMNTEDMKTIKRICGEISNFSDLYQESPLWGQVDGPVDSDVLITFLIDNPALISIAQNISKLSK